MEKSLYSMLDVSATMLITLYARARESISKNPIICDSKAVEMIEVIKKEIVQSSNPIHRKILKDRYSSLLAITIALRCRRFDKYVLDFITKFPEGTIINIGCGLDTRFERVDNGKLKWFDIDFPEVIKLRRRFMDENARRVFIEGSILSSEWLEIVKTSGPFLFLAEGVFMYLHEDDIKLLLSRISTNYSGAELVCEVTNSYWVNKMKSPYLQRKFKRQLGMNKGALFSFGIPNSRYFEEWSRDYHFLDEWNYFNDNEKKLGLVNLLSKFDFITKVQYTVHYKIGN